MGRRSLEFPVVQELLLHETFKPSCAEVCPVSATSPALTTALGQLEMTTGKFVTLLVEPCKNHTLKTIDGDVGVQTDRRSLLASLVLHRNNEQRI
jgi:hypothetical protein